MNYEDLFVRPTGRTPRGEYAGALLTLLAVIALYKFVVPGSYGLFCLLTLLFPAFVLHARRLHDMGRTAWLLIVPGALLLVSAWLRIFQPKAADPVTPVALVISAAVVLWCLAGPSRAAREVPA